LSALTEALADANQREELLAVAELNRLKGELLRRQNDPKPAEAEQCYERAISLARKQNAKSWELRATTSLARLLRDTNHRGEARAMLSEIYNWFTEGFDTADLKDAGTLVMWRKTNSVPCAVPSFRTSRSNLDQTCLSRWERGLQKRNLEIEKRYLR
jgi:predicted ATPase